MSLPSEKTKLSIQSSLSTTKNEELSIAINIRKLVTPYSTFNVFRILDWVAKKGWPLVFKQKINDKSLVEANNNNKEIVEWNLFKLFTQSTNFVKTNI